MILNKSKIKSIIPNYIKPIVRFFYYRNERKKVFREIFIRTKQNILLKEKYSRDVQQLIVFFIDGANWNTGYDNISGGILSIASIFEETEKLESVHNSKSIMVTNKSAHLLLKHTKFPNSIPIFRYSQLFKHFRNLNKVIIHIPDCYFNHTCEQLLKNKNWFSRIEQIQINILNQNILLMPTKQDIKKMFKITTFVTQTTAHQQYTSQYFRDYYGIPLHKLSVFSDTNKYHKISYKEKKDLILFSPDNNEKNQEIISILNKRLPHFKTQIIKNLNYNDYLKLISKAKFVLTFGEGLDFYFIEPIYSGSISLAIFNKDFFTPELENSFGIFDSYEELKSNIIGFIQSTDDCHKYDRINQTQNLALSTLYKQDEYLENIRKFYMGEYTYS